MSYNIVRFMHELTGNLQKEFGNISELKLVIGTDEIDGGLENDELFLYVSIQSRTIYYDVVIPFKVKEEDFTDPDLLNFIIEYIKPILSKYKDDPEALIEHNKRYGLKGSHDHEI